MPGPTDASVSKTNTILLPFGLQSNEVTVIQSHKIYLLYTNHIPNKFLASEETAMNKKAKTCALTELMF